MLVNNAKTKEMFICSICIKDPPPPVTLSGADVERVVTFKLLGGHVSNEMDATYASSLSQGCIKTVLT